MRTCRNCGGPIYDGEFNCSRCGQPVNISMGNMGNMGNIGNQNYQNIQGQSVDRRSIVLNILAFIFPLLGLIMWLVSKRTKPIRARSILNWTIAGFCLTIMFNIIGFVFNGLSGIFGMIFV